jgi:hypothetical protein
MPHSISPFACTADPAAWNGVKGDALPAHVDYIRNFDIAFRPERWLSGDAAGGLKRPQTCIVFGSGNHMCPGMHLAYLEAKLLLAALVRGYDYKLENADVLRSLVTFPGMRPKPGTDMIRLTPRKL